VIEILFPVHDTEFGRIVLVGLVLSNLIELDV